MKHERVTHFATQYILWPRRFDMMCTLVRLERRLLASFSPWILTACAAVAGITKTGIEDEGHV